MGVLLGGLEIVGIGGCIRITSSRVGGLASLLLGVGLLAALWVPGRVFGEVRPSRPLEVSIHSGWNLVSFPFAPSDDHWGVLAANGLEVWGVTGTPFLRPSTKAASAQETLPVATVSPHKGYWVWSLNARKIVLEGQRIPAPEASPASEWSFFSVAERVEYKDLQLIDALRWNASGQLFERMRVGEWFLPGLGYWVQRDPSGATVARSETTGPVDVLRTGADEVEFGADSLPPTLVVLEPARDVVHSASSWATLGGEASGDAFLGLFINGVRVSKTAGSFLEFVSLRPGENQVDITAVNQQGLRQSVRKTIVHDPDPPKISLSVHESSRGLRESTIEVSVAVSDLSLEGVSFQGEDLGPVPTFERSWPVGALARGLSRFEVRAWDRLGQESREALGLFVDDEGRVSVTGAWPKEPASRPEVDLSFVDSSLMHAAPFEKSSDSEPPNILLRSPTITPVYTSSPSVTVEALVTDKNLWDVSLNGLSVAADGALYSHTLRLFEPLTTVRIVARDVAFNESAASVDFVLDQHAPEILLSHGKRPTTYEASFVLRGAVSEKYLRALELQNESGFKTPLLLSHGFFEMRVPVHEGENRFVVRAFDRAGNVGSKTVVVTRQMDMDGLKRPSAPRALGGTSSGSRVALWWKAPTLFEDGNRIPPGAALSYRVYRDGVEVSQVSGHRYEEQVLATDLGYTYQVRAVIGNAAGTVLASIPTEMVRLKPASLAPPTAPGAFESPSVLRAGVESQEQPKTALSHFSGKTYAHVAFVAGAGSGGPQQVRYMQSSEAGKPGTFNPPLVIGELEAGAYVGDLALTARGVLLALAWTSYEGADGLSRLWVARSADGGRSFGAPKTLRENGAWKRGLSMGYDGAGHHHMVWGESGKVYYLQDLEGSASSVFDVKKRSAATELVKYKAQYQPHKDTGCACEDCWCPESYVLSDEPNPADGDRPLGPYLYRTEESFMVEPSLFVDHKNVNIVARRHRMWDSLPVPNPAWAAMAKKPVYSDVVVQRLVPTKLVVGWRSTWKHAYEPKDELLWPKLGFQHQYLYEGRWHEDDQIQIAQRPLRQEVGPGAEDPERSRQKWVDDTEANWRISVVFSDFPAEFSERPSHPQVRSVFGESMVASFEKGPSSNPNQSVPNTVYVSYSDDGGAHWSPATPVGEGYVPQLAVASTGETNIVFYQPGPDPDSGTVRLVGKDEGRSFSSPHTLNVHPPRPVHWNSHGLDADALPGAPSLSASEELFFAAWVRRGVEGLRPDQVVTTRASRVSTLSHLSMVVSKPRQTQKNTSVQVTAENKFHMRVQSEGVVALSRHVAGSTVRPGATGVGASSEVLFDADRSKNGALRPGPMPTPEPVSLSLSQGMGQVVMANDWGGLALAERAPGSQDVVLSAAFSEAGDAAFFESQASLVPGNTSGNYYRALDARDRLLRTAVDESTGEVFYYQVEYQPTEAADKEAEEDGLSLDQSLFEGADYRDARHLAGFDRVWAYTQGIALSQFSRSAGDYGEEARGIATYLCRHAVKDTHGDKILGWPFSWNTKGDDWRDARLVTGANAWVIQGLGVFIQSDAYRRASSSDRARLKSCYLNALSGLQDHRRRLAVPDVGMGSLMTAGWTTQGLVNVAAPHRLSGVSSMFKDLAGSYRFSYYSMLDAIGYEVFSPTALRVCVDGPGLDCTALSPAHPAWQDYALEDEAAWNALKLRTKSSNVVTEHNLDVLSVLNHALRHRDALGPSGTALGPWVQALESWRNELRDGIFYLLWDDTGWRLEFEEVLTAFEQEPQTQTLTEAQSVRRLARVEGLEEALVSDSLGRVITGGVLGDSDGHGFRQSPHAAIDNCSWLSLSVDYETLSSGGSRGSSVYTERLGKCLEYTILQYAKDLSFGDEGCVAEVSSCPPKRTYYGTHYFQNAFKDPYIEPSELQESSYHLEATMGLILGLFRFAHAHPEHPKSEFFSGQAQMLWAGAQAFVRDHGFVYSSQRIQDLSARLVSSTAIVWFLDVYEYLDARDNALDWPLKAYDSTAKAAGEGRAVVQDALSTLKSSVDGRFVTSGSTRRGGLLYTLLADQALSVVVLSNRGDEAGARALVDGLVSMLGSGHAVLKETGSPVDGGRDSLEAELFGYYALAWFLHRFPSNADRSALTRLLETDLLPLLAENVVRDEGPLRGLIPVPQDPSVARLEDNIMAYFVASLAGNVVTSISGSDAGPDVGSAFSWHEDVFSERLIDLCGLETGDTPARWVGQWGVDRSAVDGWRALAPCSLFAFSIGASDRALLLFEMAQALPSAEDAYARAQPAAPALDELLSSGSASSSQLGVWETHAVSLAAHYGSLVRRALSSIDPRQDEIARAQGFFGVPSSGRLSGALSTLLLDAPRGVWGAHGGSLTESPFLVATEKLSGDGLGRAKRALADRFLDTVLALLASDFRARRFDALVLELVSLQRAHDHLFRVDAPDSHEERLLFMQNELVRGMCEEGHLVHHGSISLVGALGFECETAMIMFERLFQARGSLGGDPWTVISTRDHRGDSWSSVLDAVLEAGLGLSSEVASAGIHLGNDGGLRGPVPSGYGYLARQQALDIDAERSIIEMREALRRRLSASLADGLAAAGPDTPIFFHLGAVDPIQAFHSASPDYWKRSARELRFARSIGVRHRVRFMLRGASHAAPAFPLGSAEAKNVRQLRQWINRYADGDLGVLAENAGVESVHLGAWLTSMHRMLRTGVMPVSQVDALLAGLGFDGDAGQGWKEAFALDTRPLSGLWTVAGLRAKALGRGERSGWLTNAFGDGGGTPIGPVHDESEDIGWVGTKRLLGVSEKMDVMITPLVADHGDYAVLRGRPQCLFQIENRGAPEARYEVRIDGEGFGEEVVLAGVDPVWGTGEIRSIEVCGFGPEGLGEEAEVEVNNTVTGESFWFRLPVKRASGCHSGEQLSTEDASDMLKTEEWKLLSYRSMECGDGLMLQPVAVGTLGLEQARPHVLSVLQTLRGVRSAKQLLRTTQKIQGSQSAGLSAEQVWGIVAGAVGASSFEQLSQEWNADVRSLLWKGLRIFDRTPLGSWEPVGWVSAWEVFAETEAVVRSLPIYGRNAAGDWEIVSHFADSQIYGLVQPSVYSGPRLPILDPAVPVFGHDVTSKMAVMRYVGRLDVNLSAQSKAVSGSVSPVEDFLSERGVLPAWLDEFPPEFRYPIYFMLFVAPELGEGGAQSTKQLSHSRPGIYRFSGDEGQFENIRFQKQRSLPIEFQYPGYRWALWPGTDWHLYGPPDEVDMFLSAAAYTGAAKNGNGKKGTDAKKGVSKKTKTPPPVLRPATELVSVPQLEAFGGRLADLGARLQAHGPAYAFSHNIVDLMGVLDAVLTRWVGAGAAPEAQEEPSFDVRLAALKTHTKAVQLEIEGNTLQIDGEESLSDAQEALGALLDATQNHALGRSVVPMPRRSQVALGAFLRSPTAMVYESTGGQYAVFQDEADHKPKNGEFLHAITFFDPVASFSDVDAFVQSTALPHWVPKTQTTHFEVIGGAWRREYTAKGEWVGKTTFFVEEELVEMEAKGSLQGVSWVPLLAKLLEVPNDVRPEDVIAYAGPKALTPKEIRALPLKSTVSDDPSVRAYKISLLGGGLHVVVPSRATFVFDIDNYSFDGATTTTGQRESARAVALKYLPKDQREPWFLDDGSKITFHTQGGKEVSPKETSESESSRTPANVWATVSSGPFRQLRERLTNVQLRLRSNQDMYGQWPDAAQQILAMELGLLRFRKKAGPRQKVRDMAQYEAASTAVLAELSLVLKELSSGGTEVHQAWTAFPELETLLDTFLDLTAGGVLYRGPNLGGVGNTWAQTSRAHAVVVRFRNEENIGVYPIHGEVNAPSGTWDVALVHYHGTTLADFSDVDRWVQEVLLPRWAPAAGASHFLVVGDGWSREYVDGELWRRFSPLGVYVRGVVQFAPWLEPKLKQRVAEALDVDVDEIAYAGKKSFGTNPLLRMATLERKELFEFILPIGVRTKGSLVVSPEAAPRLAESLMTYTFYGAATHKKGQESASSEKALVAMGKTLVPKGQDEKWFVASSQRKTYHGGNLQALQETTKKYIEGLSESRKKELGPIGLEVLTRFPGTTDMITASKDAFGIPQLRELAGSSAMHPRQFHVVFVPDGGYHVVLPTRSAAVSVSRFKEYRYLGFVSSTEIGSWGVSNEVARIRRLIPDGQTEPWFIVAPGLNPPYQYDARGQRLKKDLAIPRFLLQSKAPIPFKAFLDVARHWETVYGYSAELGYVVFGENNRTALDALMRHDHRVIMYYSISYDGSYPATAFARLNTQDYVFVAHRKELSSESSVLNPDLVVQARAASKKMPLVGTREDLQRAEELGYVNIHFPGLVLDTPEDFDLLDSDLPVAEIFHPHAWWETWLKDWFKTHPKTKGIELLELQLRVRGGVPWLARLDTSQGTVFLGWNSTLSPRDVADIELRDALRREGLVDEIDPERESQTPESDGGPSNVLENIEEELTESESNPPKAHDFETSHVEASDKTEEGGEETMVSEGTVENGAKAEEVTESEVEPDGKGSGNKGEIVEEEKPIVDPISEELAKKIGPLGVEVLERFPGRGVINTASNTEITPEALVGIAVKDEVSLHLIRIHDGGFYVAIPWQDPIRLVDAFRRFSSFTYLGIASHSQAGFGTTKDTSLLNSAKKRIPVGQVESFFVAAPGLLPPKWYQPGGERIPDEPGVVRFILQSDTAIPMDRAPSHAPESAYVWSAKYAYVVLPLETRKMWDEVLRYDYRVLRYWSGEANGFVPKSAFKRLKHQSYVFVAHRGDRNETVIRVHDNRGHEKADPRFVKEDRWGVHAHVAFPGLVLKGARATGIQDADVPTADDFRTQDAWQAWLLEWLERQAKRQDFELTGPLEVRVRGGVPIVAQIATNKGTLSLGWNTGLHDDEVARKSLLESLF